MLKELRFVGGAVAKKNFIPAHKHFSIDKGVITAYNGFMALSSPIAFDIDCKPHAEQLLKAINNCSPDHTVTISMTDAGRLRIVNGPYKAFIDCLEEETPHVQPEGDEIPVDGAAIRKAFETLEPLIGNDASREWVNGIFLSGGSALATCNVIVAEYWHGAILPITVNVPRDAIREVLRVEEDPTYVRVHDRSITFGYDSGKWIHSRLWEEWKVADTIRSIFEASHSKVQMPDRFFEAVANVKPFTNKQNEIYFREGAICTSRHAEGSESGASFGLDNFPFNGCYALPMLEKLDGLVESIDWSTYPNPCIFYGAGGKLRGAIIGRRMLDGSQGQ